MHNKDEQDSRCIKKERCPQCASNGRDNSGDNLAIFSNGSKHCMSCSYHENSEPTTNIEHIDFKSKDLYNDLLDLGEYKPLLKHGVTKATCERFGVHVQHYEGNFNGKRYRGPVIVFPYYRDGELIKQKICTPSKEYKWVGKGEVEPFMFDQYSGHGKKLVITEGEKDALGVSQVIGPGPWDVTSLVDGGTSSSVKSFVKNYYDLLNKYEKVILCFDTDSVGREAVNIFKEAYNQFGKVISVSLAKKDACEMLINNMDQDLKWAILTAKEEAPKSSVAIEDVMDSIVTKPKPGVPWPWEFMNEMTYGRRTKEMYVIAGDSGVGKTSLVQELVFSVLKSGDKVGLCSFEQDAAETGQRLIGSKLNKPLHIPGEWWDTEAIREAAKEFEGKIFFYDKTKAPITLQNIIDTMLYWVNVKGCKFIVLDNLTAMCSDTTIEGKRVNENQYLSHVATTLFNLVKGPLDCTLLVIAHLTKATISRTASVSTVAKKNPDLSIAEMDKMINKPGLDWESGRIPRLGEVMGGSHLPKVTDFMYVLGRNRTSEDDTEKRTLKIKNLKCRIDSSQEGRVCSLIYNRATGRLEEVVDGEVI